MARKTPSGSGALKATLDRLGALLAKHSDVKLRPAAPPSALAKLSKKVLGGAPLPADLETWFQWHDGQDGDESPSPDDNRTLLSVDEAIEAWRFLSSPDEEIQKPWKKSWLPLFTNGAGDYVVCETEGKKAGALIGYWHADEDRKVEHASLAAWAETVEKAVLRLAKKPKKERMRVELGPRPVWTRVKKKPRPGDAARKPVGTAYYWRQLLFGHEEPWCILWVKAAPDAWLKATGRPGPAEALAKLQELLEKRRPLPDWEWRKNDANVVSAALNSHGVTADGRARHVGLYEGTVVVHGTEVPHREGY